MSADLIGPIKTILYDKVEFALLFGSAIRDGLNNESDVDIGAFLRTPKPTFKEQLEFSDSLAEALHREVDFIILNTCDVIIAMQILANGTMVINNNPGLFVLYKARKISEYIDFKMDRRIIEDNLLKGRIYA